MIRTFWRRLIFKRKAHQQLYRPNSRVSQPLKHWEEDAYNLLEKAIVRSNEVQWKGNVSPKWLDNAMQESIESY